MIKIVKIITGEEIIGDVSSSDDSLSIDRPCVLQLVPSRTSDQPSMALIPYAPYTKNHKISIKVTNVIWVEEPLEDLYNHYNSIFGSGIVVANNLARV